MRSLPVNFRGVPMTVTLTRPDLYDGLAPAYDRLHARFLRLAGGAAQGVLEGAVAALLRPGMAVLDAGCGTGQLGRRLLGTEPSLRLTLLDAAPAMLAQARGLTARRVHGSLAALPFADGTFDLAVCAWALETLPAPGPALAELLRVLRPGRHLALAFCAEAAEADTLDRLVAGALRRRGTGRLLDADRIAADLRARGAARVRRVACPGPAAVLLVTA